MPRCIAGPPSATSTRTEESTPDAVVTALNGPPALLRNESKAGNWIGFRLLGKASNRGGLGARIQISAGEAKQWNHMTTSVGYASSSEPAVHFGLGGVKQVERVEIRWPSGAVQTLEGLEAGRYHTITEP
jgi:hypothetical protein